VRGQPGQGVVRVAGRGQHFHEEAADLLDEGQVHLAVGRDDGAERRHRIAGERQPVGVRQGVGGRQPARIGVFDDGDSRLAEFLRHGPRRLQIHDVVVAQLLALELFERRGRPDPTIERRLLVGVFAVAELLNALGGQDNRVWQTTCGGL
jgi:hypothetical protein